VCHTQSTDAFGNPLWGARGRLRGDPVRMPSRNFQANYQLDVDCKTEFLCTWCRLSGPSRRVYR
jgi:hypothetical protein